MKHGKRKNQRAALTLRWEATMVWKSANLLEFIFSQLSNLLPQEDIVLYRDDGLILLRKINGQLTERMRKSVITLFKEIGFKFQIETNLKIVIFLDVTFNLENSTYRSFRKPND